MSFRILQLESSPGWGGQEIRIIREAEGMRLRGHEVILAVMKGGLLAKRARDKGFLVYEMNFYRYGWIRCLLQLLYLFRKHHIQIVNTHSSLDSWIGSIAARLGRKKIIRTRHFCNPGTPGLNSRILYGRLADFVVTVSAGVIPPLAAQSGKPLKRFRSLPTGIDPEEIDRRLSEEEHLREKLGVSNDSFLIGTACFMRSWKGIEDFLQAAHALRGSRDVKWMIIGGGHDEKYRKMAEDLQLQGIVYFTGHLENPYPALNALDVFALLSTSNEGVAQAAQQAAYLKKPLVTTPTGGLSEICLHEVTGIQVPPFDSRAVADAVMRLKHDPSLCQRLGEKAHEVVLSQFTFRQTLDGMEEIYRKLKSL